MGLGWVGLDWELEMEMGSSGVDHDGIGWDGMGWEVIFLFPSLLFFSLLSSPLQQTRKKVKIWKSRTNRLG